MRTLIIGCGNLLASDDAIGIQVIRELSKYKLPPHIKIVEAGLAEIDLLDVMKGAAKVILIDALKSGEEPGTIHRFTTTNLPPKEFFSISTHNIGLIDVLDLGEKIQPESMPKQIVILGVEIESSKRFKIGLTPKVKEAIPEVIDIILKEISV